MLSTFTDVGRPDHLSLDSQGRVLVADWLNHRILLLTSQLQLQRVLIDTNSQVKLWRPKRLYYNKHTSQLYVVHSSEEGWPSDVISLFILTEAEWLDSSIPLTHLPQNSIWVYNSISFCFILKISKHFSTWQKINLAIANSLHISSAHKVATVNFHVGSFSWGGTYGTGGGSRCRKPKFHQGDSF